MTDGKVFCIDSHSPIDIAEMKRRGVDTDSLTSTIYALDEKTGVDTLALHTGESASGLEDHPFSRLAILRRLARMRG